jgi:hypothetical protein
MSAKYTPGPWVVGIDGTGSALWPHIYTEDDYEVAQISDNTIVNGEPGPVDRMALANAHLIAAAPELLEALVGILELGRKNTSNSKYDGYYDAARAAIAKAEGK